VKLTPATGHSAVAFAATDFIPNLASGDNGLAISDGLVPSMMMLTSETAAPDERFEVAYHPLELTQSN